jgi:2-iminobutanoate/2-iminopropanoate deaminase
MFSLCKWLAVVIACFVSATVLAQSGKEAQLPFSPYRAVNGFIFVSGQIGVEPQSGKLVTSSFADEVKQTMANIQAVLQQARVDFSNVVSVTVYLKDISQFAAFNQVYVQYFQPPLPSRTCVAVKELVKGANVEITVTAAVSNNEP